MDATNNTPTWTLMHTSRTWTTRHGYSTTTTLADAMHARRSNMVRNVAANWEGVYFAMCFKAQLPKVKRSTKAAR